MLLLMLLLQLPGQCRIKGGARDAAAHGPAVLGARKWWEWKIV